MLLVLHRCIEAIAPSSLLYLSRATVSAAGPLSQSRLLSTGIVMQSSIYNVVPERGIPTDTDDC